VPASSPMLYSDAKQALDHAGIYLEALQRQVNYARMMLEMIANLDDQVPTPYLVPAELQADVRSTLARLDRIGEEARSDARL
jgi:hypothetical protein